MIDRFRDLVEQSDHGELLRFREALRRKDVHDIVDSRIRAFENPTLVCPVCERPVSEENDIILIFGPRELRRKARFCGQDCLTYFLASHRKEPGTAGAVVIQEDVR